MPAMVLASVPSNVEGGSYLTFAFPIILFAVIASILYVLLFGRPHPRVPPRRIAATANAGPSGAAAAQAASVASGMSAPAGAHQETTTTGDRGNVSGGTPDGADQGTTEKTEDGE